MKSKNYNWLYWLAQFSGWLVLFGLTVFVNYQANSLTTNAFLEITCLITTAFLVSHLFRILIIKRKIIQKPFKDQWPFVLLLLLIGSVVVSFAQGLVSYLFNEKSIQEEFRIALITVYFINWAIIYTVWLMLYLFYQTLEKQRLKVIEELKLKALQHEIELNNLRSQLNPHFMFNSMNSIRALIDENPVSAKLAVTKLSGILRNSLQFSKRNFVSLREEIELVKDYLFLEKIRFEERLVFDFDLAEEIMDHPFPPLMLQTIVENAIKHGISKLPNGGHVNIKGMVQDDQLLLTVTNTGKLLAAPNINGIGVENTIKRLHLLFGDDAKMQISEQNDEVVCTLSIPYRKIISPIEIPS